MISFQSKGLIDPLCITTIGVSVKEGDNPIGFFGTGLKYAIAIILRERGAISIYRGKEEFKFTARQTTIRGAQHDIVCMNNRDLGFTTALGKQWEVWQAFREIECNTLDEGGYSIEGEGVLRADHTTIRINLAAMDECFRNRAKYFISGKPTYSTPEADFHSDCPSGVYYRGVRVADSVTQHPMHFRVNLKEKLELTEDRTPRSSYDAIATIARAVQKSTDKAFIEAWLTTGHETGENTLDLSWAFVTPTPEFLSVAQALLKDPSRPMNVTAIKLVAKHSKVPEAIACALLPNEQKDLAAAIGICHALGYTVDEYPITVVESLGENVLGVANTQTRIIRLARTALASGDAMLIGTLIEEWVHIKHRHGDCERGMQNWLLNNLVRLGRAYLAEKGKT